MKSSTKKESKAYNASFPVVYKRVGQEFENRRVVIFTNENKSERGTIKHDKLTYTVLEKHKFSRKSGFEHTYDQLKSILYHFHSHDTNLTTRMLDTMIREHAKLKYIIIYLIEMKDKDEGLEKLEVLKIQTPPVYISANTFDTYQQYHFLFRNHHNADPYMDYLKYQNIDRFYSFSHHMFRNLRHFLLNNLNDAELDHILVFSSCTLWVNGVRDMNDIDILCWKPFDELSHMAQQALLNIAQNKIPELRHLHGQNKGQSFVDIEIKGTEKWPDYWDTYLEEWAVKCGAKCFDDIVMNPRYHTRHLGLKITSLAVDINRRIRRNKPSSLTDLIMLRDVVDYSFYIPSIPLSIDDFQKKKYIINTPSYDSIKTKLLKDGYVEKKDEFHKHIKVDRKIWLKKIQSYGVHRYNKKYSITELDSMIPYRAIIE